MDTTKELRNWTRLLVRRLVEIPSPTYDRRTLFLLLKSSVSCQNSPTLFLQVRVCVPKRGSLSVRKEWEATQTTTYRLFTNVWLCISERTKKEAFQGHLGGQKRIRETFRGRKRRIFGENFQNGKRRFPGGFQHENFHGETKKSEEKKKTALSRRTPRTFSNITGIQ